MTGGLLRSGFGERPERRLDLCANGLRQRATGAKAASGRRIDSAQQITPASGAPFVRCLGSKVGREARSAPRIRMAWPPIDLSSRRTSTTLPRYMTRTRSHRKLMTFRSCEIGRISSVKANRCFKLADQAEHLGFDGFVERRNRLVENNQAWFRREGPRDVHALALPAREFVWKGICEAVSFRGRHRPGCCGRAFRRPATYGSPCASNPKRCCR